MIFGLTVPALNPNMELGVIEALHQVVGAEVKAGDKLLDLSIMLGANFAQDCPPISYFRLVVRERAWLRAILVDEGNACRAGTPLALFSTEPDEPLAAASSRPLRCVSASIMFSPAMFSGRAA